MDVNGFGRAMALPVAELKLSCSIISKLVGSVAVLFVCATFTGSKRRNRKCSQSRWVPISTLNITPSCCKHFGEYTVAFREAGPTSRSLPRECPRTKTVAGVFYSQPVVWRSNSFSELCKLLTTMQDPESAKQFLNSFSKCLQFSYVHRAF